MHCEISECPHTVDVWVWFQVFVLESSSSKYYESKYVLPLKQMSQLFSLNMTTVSHMSINKQKQTNKNKVNNMSLHSIQHDLILKSQPLISKQKEKNFNTKGQKKTFEPVHVYLYWWLIDYLLVFRSKDIFVAKHDAGIRNIGVFPKWNRNSVNSGNVINH